MTKETKKGFKKEFNPYLLMVRKAKHDEQKRVHMVEEKYDDLNLWFKLVLSVIVFTVSFLFGNLPSIYRVLTQWF